jgi:hypothetical protein
MPAWAAIRVLAATPDAVVPALDAVLAREGLVPFPADRVPPGYPAERGEFARFAIDGPDPLGATTLRPDAWRTVFARALALARALPGLRLAAAVVPPDAPLRLKTYARGDLALAIGEDDDDELFYRPARADAAAIAALLAAWGLPPAPAADPAAAWAALAPGFVPEPLPQGAPGPRLYVRRTSRLALEA